MSNTTPFLLIIGFYLLLVSCSEEQAPEMVLEDGSIVRHINGVFKTTPTSTKSEISYEANYYENGKIVQTTLENDHLEKFIIPQNLPIKEYSAMLKAMIYMHPGDSTYIELAKLNPNFSNGIGIKVHEVLDQNGLAELENQYRQRAAEHTEELLEIVENRSKYEQEFKPLSNGLKKMTLTEGTTSDLTVSKIIKLRYIASTAQQAIFEAKYSYTEPFLLNPRKGGFIEGFLEGISYMKVGEVAVLEIPSKKAYGKEGLPPLIEANETLYFYIEIDDAH